ncbi:carboxypeptidase-like regulatory domain-containing protein [Singulisphaera sp. Ch08]|uniref:Carboxypeptidase-like regulatory domain-containing protein n=1 Tax=Singulisphaera sp. Ch08 TaxID=3120278 RepID=A0AAU7CK04_9BACT
MKRAHCLTSLALLAAGVIGCGGGEAKRYPVHGIITLNGKPYPNATVEFVPDPSNVAISAGNDVTGPEGTFKIASMGRSGLPLGKYKVIVSVKPSEEEEASQKAKYEDEEQRRMALESLGINPAKQAAKAGKPGGEFQAEVTAGDNALEYDVKSKSGKS